MWKAIRRVFANDSNWVCMSQLINLGILVFYFLSKKETVTTEILGVVIQKNPPQSKLTELRVSTWPTWEGGPTKIPWTFKATETMYLLKGKVKVTVDGHGDDGSFEIGGGDLVVFPKGMNITWEVIEAVKKHYSLDKEMQQVLPY